MQSLRPVAACLNYYGTMETAITLGKRNNHDWDYCNQGNYFGGTHLLVYKGLNTINTTNMYYHYFEFILTY